MNKSLYARETVIRPAQQALEKRKRQREEKTLVFDLLVSAWPLADQLARDPHLRTFLSAKLFMD